MSDYPIFDADRHVAEPIDAWEQFLDPQFKRYMPYFEYINHGDSLAYARSYAGPDGEVPLAPALMVDGQPVMRKMLATTRVALALAAAQRMPELFAAQDANGQLKNMDQAGIQGAVLYPTFGMYLTSIDDMAPSVVNAFACAYNNWLHEFCQPAPQRLRPAALIPRHDPAHMLPELQRIADFGWKTVVLRPNPVAGRLLSDAAYEPFWDGCERLGISVAVHEGTHTRLPTVGSDRFATRFAQHACSHAMEQMMALLALIEGGVLERHPQLQVAFLEAGGGWLPYWLWKLDAEYRSLAGEVSDNVRMPPSEYFRRQCYVSLEPDEPLLNDIIDFVGEDRVLFGSDFPHVDHSGDLSAEIERLQQRLAKPLQKKLFWDNPAAFYGF